jgi:hypothetical protein
MESPLRCLAKRLGVGYSSTWYVYLSKIDKKLRDSNRRLSRRNKEFLSNAATLLFAVKDAWRNDSMHLSEKAYGPDQATRIFETSKNLMVHLSSELSERRGSNDGKRDI